MSLPIAGAPRPPTHEPISMATLMNLARELDEAMNMGGHAVLDACLVDEIAGDLGARPSHLYAAAALMTAIPFDQSEQVRFVVCAGGCQRWGAVDLLDTLVSMRAQRVERGASSFGIVARRCLDTCDQAAVVRAHTPDGDGVLVGATPARLEEAVNMVCDP